MIEKRKLNYYRFHIIMKHKFSLINTGDETKVYASFYGGHRNSHPSKDRKMIQGLRRFYVYF